jgi:hypothetical protein
MIRPSPLSRLRTPLGSETIPKETTLSPCEERLQASPHGSHREKSESKEGKKTAPPAACGRSAECSAYTKNAKQPDSTGEHSFDRRKRARNDVGEVEEESQMRLMMKSQKRNTGSAAYGDQRMPRQTRPSATMAGIA